MSREFGVRAMQVIRTESLSERIEYHKKLLNGEIPKYFYDYCVHSREYLNMVISYGAIVRTKDLETDNSHRYNDHFRT